MIDGTAAPATPSATQPASGAGAQSPAPAPQPLSSREASLERLLGDAPADQQQSSEPRPSDPIEADLADIPAGPARDRLAQKLRSEAGRVAALQRQLNERAAQQPQAPVEPNEAEQAQVAQQMVRDALAGVNPYELALRHGLSAEETEAFIQVVERARGWGGAQPGPGAAGAAAAPQFTPGQFTFEQMWAGLEQLGQPGEKSWTAPYVAAQTEVMAASEAIARAKAAIAVAETPEEKAQWQTIVDSEGRRLLAAHARAAQGNLPAMKAMFTWMYRELLGRMQPLLEAHEQAARERQQVEQQTTEAQQFIGSIAGDVVPDGLPGAGRWAYGPEGYGICEVDSLGQPLIRNGELVLTEKGRAVVPGVQAIMQQHGLGWTKANFELALDLFAHRALSQSDGVAQPAPAGVALAGGDPTLPVEGAPGDGEARQSTRGGRSAARVPMF